MRAGVISEAIPVSGLAQAGHKRFRQRLKCVAK